MRAALVVNPHKLDDPDGLRRLVAERSATHGWEEPEYLPTTDEDFGTGLTRAAVERGVDAVIACGGDGTVMAVVTGLAGTGVPLVITPCGTGNLLARNLGLSLDDVEQAVEVTFTGRDDTLDVGTVHVTRHGEVPERADGLPATDPRRFVVMAGIGFDAVTMADAPSGLKRALGWPAYVVSGARHLLDPPLVVGLRLDDGERMTRRVRTVLVANVGELTAGIALLPDADPRDGVLDVAVLGPRTPADYARLVARLLRRSGRGCDHTLETFRARKVEIRTARPQLFELDGDPLQEVTSMEVTAEACALTVRVPR